MSLRRYERQVAEEVVVRVENMQMRWEKTFRLDPSVSNAFVICENTLPQGPIDECPQPMGESQTDSGYARTESDQTSKAFMHLKSYRSQDPNNTQA
ncbi:hypothetical protein DID88_005458 [Monilinia fructigena]|uniref:Uncharacterized protein n=1 Tax=Monilinia fructigena TaxID=38457 RepID=A0A395J276_9HELO|nr:hypothetical protein DID88_005458 [Monilinia fructigena]